MRLYYQADCAIMAAGTIRGDQIYSPGVLRARDVMDWCVPLHVRVYSSANVCSFPFEDPVVVLKVSGKDILEALENGVRLYPALEGINFDSCVQKFTQALTIFTGRFPQVSHIHFQFDPKASPGARIRNAKIGGSPVDECREYILATREYMTRGKGSSKLS